MIYSIKFAFSFIVMSSVERDEEGICYAYCPLEALIPGKFISDPAGHYSNQSIQLVVDQKSHAPVILNGKESDDYMSYATMKEEESC